MRFSDLGPALALGLSTWALACGSSNRDNPFSGPAASGAGSGAGGMIGPGGAPASGGSGAVGGSGTPSGGASSGQSGGTGPGSGGAPGGGADTGGAPSVGGAAPTGGTSAGAPSGGSGGDPVATGGSPTQGGGGQGTAGDAGSDAGGSGGAGGEDGCLPDDEICDGLDNDCDDEVDGPGNVCPDGCTGVALEGRGYLFCLEDATVDQEAAQQACDAQNMHLVFLESADENAAVRDAALDLDPSLHAFWIGASDGGEEGQWRWVDGDPDSGELFWSGQAMNAGGMPVADAYSNWAGGRPDHGDGDEDCVMMTLDRADLPAGSWDDDPCNRQAPFVCESR